MAWILFHLAVRKVKVVESVSQKDSVKCLETLAALNCEQRLLPVGTNYILVYPVLPVAKLGESALLLSRNARPLTHQDGILLFLSIQQCPPLR